MSSPGGNLWSGMSQLPHLPLLPDGTLPPAMLIIRWLARLREDGGRQVALHRLPPGNGLIPDLLALAGVQGLALVVPNLERAFRWEGCGGSRIAVNGADDNSPVHHGHLPPSPAAHGDASPLLALLDLARLEDASGMHDAQTAGAAWEYILAAVGMAAPPRVPPLASRTIATATTTQRLGAWNPLPFARHATVALPMQDDAPWAVEDDRGARHPVQVVEGPLGRELLTTMAFGALEGLRLVPLDDPVPGCHWEVSRTVIDNGRLRAELDPLGQIVRLCCDGNFLDLAGPAIQPLCDGLPLGGSAQLTVLEDGPVRARIDVARTTPLGNLHLTYTLHAHEDTLRIAASWQGDGDLVLDIPTAFRDGLARVSGEGLPWRCDQAANVVVTVGRPQHGVSWAALGAEAGGKGVLLVGARPLVLAIEDGHLLVQVHTGTLFGLTSTARSTGDALPPADLARSLAVPARSFSADSHLTPALRLAGRLVPWWVRRPAEWTGELLLADADGVRGSTTLYLPQGIREAWRVDACGVPIARLPATPENDGVTIEHAAHEVLLVRWR